jgi:hypothetical protein
MKKADIALEIQPKRILGRIKTKAGSEFNVYTTASRAHVLMFLISESGQQEESGKPIRLCDLGPKLRQRLGC